MTTVKKIEWKTGTTRSRGRGNAEHHASCVIGGSHCLLSVTERDDGSWLWMVAVDGVVGDSNCEISDGMRRDWLSGSRSSEWDAKRHCEAAQFRQPASWMPIDIGYDPRTIGQAVVIESDDDAGDAVCFARWADREGQPRELLASVWSIAQQMRRDGYEVKIESNGRNV